MILSPSTPYTWIHKTFNTVSKLLPKKMDFWYTVLDTEIDILSTLCKIKFTFLTSEIEELNFLTSSCFTKHVLAYLLYSKSYYYYGTKIPCQNLETKHTFLGYVSPMLLNRTYLTSKMHIFHNHINYDVFYPLKFLMDCSKIRNMESLLNFWKNPTLGYLYQWDVQLLLFQGQLLNEVLHYKIKVFQGKLVEINKANILFW